jgi:hypothetical protein
MVTDRNRRTPSGNFTRIPANTEVVRSWNPGIGNGSERLNALLRSEQPAGLETRMRFAGTTSNPTMFRRSSRPLLGVYTSTPNRGRLSVSKGTREARPSRVIAQPSRLWPVQASPMRRTSGGAFVVVRGWESQPHGEGGQDISFWAAEGFANREGSR